MLSDKINIKYLLPLIFIILVIVSINGFMGEDEGRFSYMGRIWANNGLPPYAYSMENKTPGIFILNAISFDLFGTNYFFLRLVGIMVLTVSSLLVYKISTIIFDKDTGIISMLIFGLTMSWRDLDGAFASYTETFMVLFVLLALYLIISPTKNKIFKLGLSGLSVGFALAFKQIALTSAFAILIFILFYNSDKKRVKEYINEMIYYGTGVVIGTIISILPILFSGVSLIDYIDGAWLLLFDKGSTPTLIKRFTMGRELWLSSRIVFFYPFIIFALIHPVLKKNTGFILLFIWLLVDFIGVNASGYYFGHQIKQLLPSLSIIVGATITYLVKSVSSSSPNIIAMTNKMIFILILFLLPYQSLADNLIRLTNKNYIDQNKIVGQYIRDNTNENDYVFTMTNANAIQSYTDRVSASKYFNPLFMNEASEYEYVLNDLITKKPKYIVLRKNEKQFTFPDTFHKYVQNNYRLSEEMYGFQLYLIEE